LVRRFRRFDPRVPAAISPEEGIVRKLVTSGLALALVFIASTAASAQRRVTGKVESNSGELVAGATVNIVGTLIGTLTAADGKFAITIPTAGDVQLSVRRLGFRRQVVTVTASQTDITVRLEKDVMRLDEVVVTGTATTIDRAHAATATQTINSEEISRVPALDLTNALQGKVVGARINMNSGAPGGGGQIQIRGVTSLNGNGEPLFVVDGVLISNASIPGGMNTITRASGSTPSSTQDNMVNRLADVNPNDIESIEVLKSAAASSMYGSRASNGVVLITTKRGRSGTPKFSLSQRYGAYSPMKLLNSRQFQDTSSLLEAISCAPGTACTGNAGAAYVRANFSNTNIPHFDYQNDLFNGGAGSFETVGTVSGGTDNGSTRYYMSGTNKYDDGTLLNTQARMQTLRMSVDQLFGQKWTLSAGLNMMRTLAARGISNNDNTNTSPYYVFGYTPAVIDLNTLDATGSFPVNPFSGSNPFQTMTYIKNDENVFREIGNLTVTHDLFNTAAHRVQLRSILGVDRFVQDNEIYSPNFLQFEAQDALLGSAMQGDAISRQWNGSFNGVWTFTPSNRWFTATGSAGLGSENRYTNIMRIQGRGLLPGVPLANQGTAALNHAISEVQDQFYFAQEEVLFWHDRINATIGFRAERSSANGDRKKFFNYPKASISYRMDEPIPFVNSLKLRTSMGKTGNQPNYGVRDLVLGNGGLIDGRVSLAAPSSLGNPNIEPEKLTEVEFGADASFVDNRIGLEVTRFTRTVRDMFLFVPLPLTSGTSNQIANAGTMETSGWEVGGTLSPIRRRDFDWTSRVNYYKFEGKITELPVPAFISSSGFGTAYGRARAYCPGFTAAGTVTLSTLGKCGGTGMYDPDGTGPLPASEITIEPGSLTAIWGNKTRCDSEDVRLKGCTLDITAVDTIIGDATPKFEMSFGNEMRYKALNVSFLLDWRNGGEVSNMTQSLFDEGQNSWDFDKPSPNPAFNPFGATKTSLGQYRYDRWNGGRQANVYIQDGSYVKLREVTLAYQLPSTFVARYFSKASEVRANLSGRNLKMWSDYWGVDPEVNNFGNSNVARQVDLAPFPATKSIFFGLSVVF
jgi:TonB-linked SusC/RagA family outer membrane protein